jgi:Xaa-Pro dipeptidase
MGRETYRIPLALFQENRTKLVDRLDNGHVVFLLGGKASTRFDSDHELKFRQESYFYYLTGVKEPDCGVAIDTTTGHTTLLIPKHPTEYATIMGKIDTPQEWKDHYQVDDVQYLVDHEQVLEQQQLVLSESYPGSQLLLMHGLNTDSGNMYPAPIVASSRGLPQDTTTLFPILAECRVIKTPQELLLLEHVSQISSFAHAYVMRNCKPGMMEYQCESLFLHYCYYNYGCRLVSYTNICGCGPNAAVLHYGHAGANNNSQLAPEHNVLYDMGAEYMGYASDITCSFPANGKFTAKYRAVYQGVLNAQIAVYHKAKPGVSYVDCHRTAEAEILKALVAIGIVVLGPTQTIEDLVQLRLGAVFMPHGLGHLLGLDTHDVGGYLPGHPERSPLPGLKSLRMSRILQQDMVLTIEPGCYFINHLLDEALQDPILSQHLNGDLLQEYRGYGGVRLEDVVHVAKEGVVNFTVCPRTPEEIEFVMAGGMWPPTKDTAPELRRVNLTKPMPLGPPPSV